MTSRHAGSFDVLRKPSHERTARFDAASACIRAIESDVGFGIFYAISGNSGRHWDISETIERLGYRPQDDAEDHAERLDALMRAEAPPA